MTDDRGALLNDHPAASVPPDMPLSTTGKRRTSTVNNPNSTSKMTSSDPADLHPHAAAPDPLLKAPPNPPPSDNDSLAAAGRGASPVSRRRRFIIYTLAFATMLAMSSVLDVRRAALRNRHAKLQLTLPSASLSSLSDDADLPAEAMDHNGDDLVPAAAVDIPAAPVAVPPVVQPANPPPPPQDAAPARHEYKISQQELDDGVDQLIAHVDQEEIANAAAVSNSTSLVNTSSSDPNNPSLTDAAAAAAAAAADHSSVSSPASSSAASSSSTSSSSTSADSSAPSSDHSSAQNAIGPTLNESAVDDSKLSTEDTFHAAVTRLHLLLKDEKFHHNADENDLRTLQALELQATRGDCELKSGASLFKTDAEAASNVDIERTHPLWGAWCLFMGSYKSDAMRDYVTKELVVEQKVNHLRNITLSTSSPSASSSTTAVNATTFDPNAASLDDVMPTDQQSTLRKQAEMVMDHLQENDLRHLAALSMQATFGDCGPYGKEMPATAAVKDADTGPIAPEKDLRKLREPLFEQTVTRRKGALWGAWCVMQGKKRTAAAANLSQRVEFLVDQLTRSQEAAAAADQDTQSRQDVDLDTATREGTATDGKLDVVVRSFEHVPDVDNAHDQRITSDDQ